MPHKIRFECFEADLDSGQLRKRGARLRLRPQPFQVLSTLLEHPGQVVSRDDLRRRLWGDDVCVDFENNLNTAVAQLREVLGDAADHPSFIETLPKRGYRFIAGVYEIPKTSESENNKARMLVLPFTNLTGDPAQDYMADAITDELITSLANVAQRQVAVIARTTSMHYKGSHKDVAQIGHELAVNYLVEGGVRGNDDRLEISVQLIRTSDQTHLCAKKYEAARRDIFNLQGRIAQSIATYIPGVNGIRGESVGNYRGPEKSPGYLAAYNEYIQGRSHLAKGTPVDLEAARQHLERAISCDPTFALAHDALAESYWYRGYFGILRPREAFSAGILQALRALEIDNNNGETHALLGQFHKTLEYNWAEVHREMALARQLDPNSPLVKMRYAVSELMPHGRLDEAAAELEKALELDPLSLFPRFWLGIVFLLSRGFQRAVDEAQRLLELDPSYFPAYFVMGNGYRYLGTSKEAIRTLRKAVDLSGGASAMLGWLGLVLATSGEQAESREILHQLYTRAEHGYVPPTSFAWIHLGLGELDRAFEWLNRGVDDCDQLMMPIKSYAFFDPIRKDPRFAVLLRKMNLAR